MSSAGLRAVRKFRERSTCRTLSGKGAASEAQGLVQAGQGLSELPQQVLGAVQSLPRMFTRAFSVFIPVELTDGAIRDAVGQDHGLVASPEFHAGPAFRGTVPRLVVGASRMPPHRLSTPRAANRRRPLPPSANLKEAPLPAKERSPARAARAQGRDHAGRDRAMVSVRGDCGRRGRVRS